MQCWLEEEKETGDGLATIAAVRRGNSLAATVAVLAPEEETERRRLSDYSCSVGAKKGNEDSDYSCSVGARRKEREEDSDYSWCAKGKRKDDDYSTVAVLARKRKMATVGALAQKEMGDKVRQSELTYLSRVD